MIPPARPVPRSTSASVSLRRAATAVAVALLASAGFAAAQDDADNAENKAARPGGNRVEPHGAMLRYPDVSKDRIVFSYGGDLWTVERDGGVARPLASPPGQEMFPKFSPDGQSIAFVGNYDGDRDLYLIDSFGGLAERLTYHPANETLQDWAGDGKLLFSAGLSSGNPRPITTSQLYLLDLDDPSVPEELPVPYGASASLGEDGKTLAYTPHSRDFRTWKRYRGGMATDIWMFDLDSKEATNATEWEGTDTAPMLFGGKLYYLSDRVDDANDSGRLNLWVHDPETGESTRLTNFTDWDVKFPSMGPGADDEGEIIFQHGSDLMLLSLADDAEAVAVEVQIPGATPNLRERTIDAAEYIGSGNIGPTGARVLAEGRGDLFSLPAETGFARPLTDTPGAAERHPAWSPDGRWVVYSSDAGGEYNLYLRAADAPAGVTEATQLTDQTGSFFYTGQWSPDSTKYVVQDQTGKIYLLDFAQPEAEGDDEADEGDAATQPASAPALDPGAAPPEPTSVEVIDTDPFAGQVPLSWSPDSRWIAYHRGGEEAYTNAIYIYDTAADDAQPTQVTSDFFSAGYPAFDREGDYLYFVTSIDFSGPSYEQAGTTFVYTDLDRIVAVPLRADVENPMLPELDEEAVEEHEAEEEESEDATIQPSTNPATQPADGADDAEDAEADDAEDADEEEAGPAFDTDSPIHGKWSGELRGLGAMGAPDPAPFDMTVYAYADGTFGGSSTSDGETSDFDSVSFSDGTITATTSQGPVVVEMTGSLAGEEITGTWAATMNGQAVVDGTWSASRSGDISADEAADAAKASSTSPGDVDPVEIELEGFEQRAMMLPIDAGQFTNLAVNDKNQLLYVRATDAGLSNIMLFDLAEDEPKEGAVASGIIDAGTIWPGFMMSADGKKLLVGAPRPGQFGILQGGGRNIGMAVINASKGQSINQLVPTVGMEKTIDDPRAEWKQLVVDAWRRHRDYFYVENMHGVDWDAVLEQYLPMVDDAASREDVGYIIGEMIGELNVGHAYAWGGEPTDNEPSRNVGLLGADFAVENDAFQITKIYNGAPYDVDARSPLSMPGVDVEEGDYFLAVNGRPIDASESIFKVFTNLAGRLTTLTVSDQPELDPENENQRDVTITPIADESGLRYRAWVTHNRDYVLEKSGGRVGYIYVPDTGTQGQDELFRQFYGQMHLPALVIDERWNGGGQIPTRFIELLNRPTTNYWARRNGRDWKWPPDGHDGPKAMLINGLAGSGGDMFPWLFKEADLGPLIGTRTWGGLVGISGVPPLIDTGYTAVPNFGFYEKDGTWGIEGHGVDPDMEVVDDPAKMQDDADPQLDAAIEYLVGELDAGRGPKQPERPADPDRRRIGIAEDDK